jgi:hypothetical protein
MSFLDEDKLYQNYFNFIEKDIIINKKINNKNNNSNSYIYPEKVFEIRKNSLGTNIRKNSIIISNKDEDIDIDNENNKNFKNNYNRLFNDLEHLDNLLKTTRNDLGKFN